MSIFDEKAYDYLTQPDNWSIAREIKDRMGEIESRLLNEFWEEVKKGIEGKLDLKEWKVKISEDIYESDSYISFSHSVWKDLFSISYMELEGYTYIGVFREDGDSKKVSNALFEQMRKELLEKDKRMKNGGNEWCHCYFYIGDDFRQTQTLNKILPSNRKTLVDKYTSEFLSLSEKAKSIIDEAMKQLK